MSPRSRRPAPPTAEPQPFTGVAEGRGKSIHAGSALATAKALLAADHPVPQHLVDAIGPDFDEAALLREIAADAAVDEAEAAEPHVPPGDAPAPAEPQE
jgi:hypothetical protein